jgi:PPM family protein phosphatase
VRLSAGFASNRGLVRLTNEDSFLVRKGLYVVCDGMGGARAGEVASQMACESMLAVDPETAGRAELRDAIVDANEHIAARSMAEARLLGMGTTLTSALIREGTVLLGHVGDSRAYLLHEGGLRQVTDDHSWVGEMVRRGEITRAEAATHPHRSVITKALGTDGQAEPDLVELTLEAGDRVLICSDGLSGMVSDESIQEILRRPDDPQVVADALVEAALKGGGEDNVTVVVVEAGADDQTAAAGDDGGSDGAGSDDGGADSGSASAGSGAGSDAGAGAAAPAGAGGAAPDDVTLGPTDRGEERSSVPGFMRPALGVGAKLSRRPPIWAKQAQRPAPAAEAPATSGHWSRRKWILTAMVVVIILALAIAAFAVFNSNVYYVGTSDGMVALYQGLPASVLGIRLSSLVEIGTVRYDALPQYQQERVNAHDLVGKAEGQAFLRGLTAPQ